MRLISQYKITSVQLSDLMASKFFHTILLSLCAGFLLLPVQGKAQLPDLHDPRFDENAGGFSAASPHPRKRGFNPLYRMRGVVVEEHHDGTPWKSPQDAMECRWDTYDPPCAWVKWDMDIPAELGREYEARVPGLIPLYGQGKDIWWAPMVRCMIFDPRNGTRTVDLTGVSCRTVLKHPWERMEWLVGGHLEGREGMTRGKYEGNLPLMVTRGDATWETILTVSYEIFTEYYSCPEIRSSATQVGITGLPAKTAGTAEIVTAAQVWSGGAYPVGGLELSGDDLTDKCSTDGSMCGATWNRALLQLIGRKGGQSVKITFPEIDIHTDPAPDAPEAVGAWKHIIGNWNKDGVLVETVQARGVLVFDTDLYWWPVNPNDPSQGEQTALFIGGGTTLGEWDAGRYDQSFEVVVECGPPMP